MAYITINYKQLSFEENPGLITWMQQFLIRFFESYSDHPTWTNEMIQEWVMNSEVEIYKYFFDETILNEEYKIKWSVNFIDSALRKINSMTIEEFSLFIGENINPTVDFERLKKILLNVKLMLENKEPIKTN